MNMFLKECTTQEYIEDTLDPIPSLSLFSQDQYFYYLCLNQRYIQTSCPSYLTENGFNQLKVGKNILTGTMDIKIYKSDLWST